MAAYLTEGWTPTGGCKMCKEDTISLEGLKVSWKDHLLWPGSCLAKFHHLTKFWSFTKLDVFTLCYFCVMWAWVAAILILSFKMSVLNSRDVLSFRCALVCAVIIYVLCAAKKKIILVSNVNHKLAQMSLSSFEHEFWLTHDNLVILVHVIHREKFLGIKICLCLKWSGHVFYT